MSTASKIGVVLVAFGLLAGVWVVNVSRAGTKVEGCPADCATAGERQAGPLRVMSLNMLHGFPRFERLARRLDTIAEEIRRQDADIVCLQEVPWTPHLGSGARYLAERTGLNYLYLRANGNRHALLFEEGEAILSRYPLHGATFVELQPQAGFFEHRVVLRAVSATPWGDMPVFVTHLTHGDPVVNQGQAATLIAFVESFGDDLSLVAGDFNAMADSPQIEAIAGRWLDAFAAASPADPGFTCCVDDLSAGPGEPLEKRIDYLFLVHGRAEQVVSSRLAFDRPARDGDRWLRASDHIGLLVTLALE